MKKLLILLMVLSSCKIKQEADIIVFNARIQTGWDEEPRATYMAVKDGRILAVGNEREVMGAYEAKETLNANGGFIFPGFIDSHCHFMGYAKQLGRVDLTGTRSWSEVIETVQAYEKGLGEGEWITGRGWDQNDWETREFPDKRLLDSLFPNRPLLLQRVDGHAAIANQAALNKAGITNTTTIEGGVVLLNNGSLTGILIDNAVDKVVKVVPQESRERLTTLAQKASENCAAAGLTAMTDAGLDFEDVILIDSLQKAGIIKQRIHVMLNPEEKNFDWIRKTGGIDTEWLRVRSFKIYADGALGSRGALMKQAYSDDPGNYGLLLTTEAKIRKTLEFCISDSCQAATHCIGDSAAALMLRLYGEYLGGPNDRRWRIEHAQVVDSSDRHYFRDFTVIPSVQPVHATSDMPWAEKRTGPERIRNAYAYRSLLSEVGIIAYGSDFPVENINPFHGFYAAVERKSPVLKTGNAWYPAEKISRKEALNSLTLWGAITNFADHFSGTLEPGKVADFVILDRDIISCPANEIPETRVMATYVSGRKIN